MFLLSFVILLRWCIKCPFNRDVEKQKYDIYYNVQCIKFYGTTIKQQHFRESG